MNGRAARLIRRNGSFDTSDPGLASVRVLLFGDRFKGGFGLQDPAYMPVFPHEAAAYLMSSGTKMWDKYHSAADLEAYVETAPAIDDIGRDDGSERRYDDAARLAAKWVLGRLRAVPDDRKLNVTFWETMGSTFPRLVELGLGTIQRDWARSAALRIIDAYRADGHT